MTLKHDVKNLKKIVAHRSGEVDKTVYGVVRNLDDDGKPNIIRRWKGKIGLMEETDDEPTILCAEKLEPMLLKHKRVKVMYGGRAGSKSIFAMDSMIGDVNANASGVFCLREHMKSLSQSIYRGILGRIDALSMSGFNPVPSRWEINHANDGIISFGGLQNVRDMKSLFNYKFFLLEESDNTSQMALDVLGPTLRGVDDAEMWLLFNSKFSTDPVSKEYIIPYQKEINRHGYYEDDHHLIINLNYDSNPWFFFDKGLVEELEKDKNKRDKKLMSKARFNHIWLGAFMDSIENGIIEPDWVDAAIDAAEKLGFEGTGGFIAAHDVSDTGDDDSTLGIRQGSVIKSLEVIEGENANRKFDTACGLAVRAGVHKFVYDASGLGAVLRDQSADNFANTKIEVIAYKGATECSMPDAIYAYDEIIQFNKEQRQLTNKDVFYNRRAQDYIALAERFRKTYDAVENGVYSDPGELISIPGDLECLQELRSQLGKLPLKPNGGGKILLFSKEEGRRGILQTDGTRIIIPSPDLADTLAMMFSPACDSVKLNADIVIPKPTTGMGIQASDLGINRGRFNG